jgi:hypothetical protein
MLTSEELSRALSLVAETDICSHMLSSILLIAASNLNNLAEAKREAESLAMSLWEKYYKEESPNFELCDSVAGVISQIDNMTTGLTKKEKG